jgi:hypothetical protein
VLTSAGAVEVTAPRVNDKRIDLCVPKTSSTSCDMGVFVDDAAEAVAPLDFELI